MEKKFAAAWAGNREKAAALGIKMRPVTDAEAVKTAKRTLSGQNHRICGNSGFWLWH